jgi:hypothetical protein
MPTPACHTPRHFGGSLPNMPCARHFQQRTPESDTEPTHSQTNHALLGSASGSGGDDLGNLGELGSTESAGSQGRGTDAEAGGDHRRAGVERNGVAVHGDADGVQEVFGLLAVQLRVAQVNQDQVNVRAAGEDRDASLGNIGLVQAVGDDLGTLEDALLALLELFAAGDLERNSLGRRSRA